MRIKKGTLRNVGGIGSSPTKHIAARKIQAFMRKYANFKYDSLDERIKIFTQVKSHLKNVRKNSCLQSKRFRTGNGYTINDIINLESVLSDEGFFGIIYKTSIKDVKYPIATKVMSNDDEDDGNKNETLLSRNISNNVLKTKLSRHFLLNYKNFYCNQPDNQLPDKVKDEKYFISLNEMAAGDFQNLCMTNKGGFLQKHDMVLNVILQCFLSIATFHKLGWLHFDSHSGNFLYTLTKQTKSKTSYYHYQILGKDYYLKDCGITMLLNDFGLAKPYDKTKPPRKYAYTDEELEERGETNDKLKLIYYFDYRYFLQIFGNEEYRLVDLEPLIKPFIDGIVEHSKPDVFENENLFIDYICSTFVSGDCPVKDMFLETLPVNATIINKKPYIIDDTLENKLPQLLSPTQQATSSRQSKSSSRQKSQSLSTRPLQSQSAKQKSPPKSPKQKATVQKHTILDERTATFDTIQNILKTVQEMSCLKRKNNGYTIDGVVNLEKVIESEDEYRVRYHSTIKNMTIKNMKITYPSTATIMMDDIKSHETVLTTKISNKILKNKLSRHFLFCYKTFYCNISSYDLPDNVKGQKYIVYLHESTVGNLFNLFLKPNYEANRSFFGNETLLLNVILQCFLSISTFHMLGWQHNLCYPQSFLYTELQSESNPSYYYYKILGKDYYLKDCGITMMLHNFGGAKKYDKGFILDYIDYFTDFNDIYQTELSPAVQPFIHNIMNLMNVMYSSRSENENEFIKQIYSAFASPNCPVKDSFLETLPVGASISNNEPYIIDDTIKTKL